MIAHMIDANPGLPPVVPVHQDFRQVDADWAHDPDAYVCSPTSEGRIPASDATC